MARRFIPTMLVGQSALLREGLTRILRGSNLRVNQSVSTIDALRVESQTRHGPPLLVIECGDNIGPTLKEIEKFKTQHASGRVAVVTGDHKSADLVSLFAIGTNVVLTKSATSDTFVRVLELAALGETLLPQELLPYVFAENANQHSFEDDAPDRTPQLSGRERSILDCLVQGASNKIIARMIGIAESTVKVHVKTILRKIRVHNRTQAAIWAMDHQSTGIPSEIKLLPRTQLLPNNPQESASSIAVKNGAAAVIIATSVSNGANGTPNDTTASRRIRDNIQKPG